MKRLEYKWYRFFGSIHKENYDSSSIFKGKKYLRVLPTYSNAKNHKSLFYHFASRKITFDDSSKFIILGWNFQDQ